MTATPLSGSADDALTVRWADVGPVEVNDEPPFICTEGGEVSVSSITETGAEPWAWPAVPETMTVAV